MVPGSFLNGSATRALKPAAWSSRKPCEAIDFLEGQIPADALAAAALQAGALRAAPEDVLIASGVISPHDYYARLADCLDAEFMAGAIDLDVETDWRAALRTGAVRLHDGRWLMAPRGEAIVALLQRVSGPRLALTTPERFERAIFAQFGREIADEASEGLTRANPDFCARGGGGAALKWTAFVLAVVLPAELIFGMAFWAATFLVIAIIMSVGVLVRLASTLLSLAPARKPAALFDDELPTFSVLIALYDEAGMAARLVAGMKSLDYPAAKLEVIFLVEAEDEATRAALAAQDLPPHFRIVLAPDGAPRTKPRALNIGLMIARGERLVIYDAEDRPEPDQLRKAAARFRAGSPKLAVLQASLRIENHADSWLTRLFAIDYAAHFDVLLPGMARLGLPLPLGGTSNHFRTAILREVGGWDAWNVTEDADLGLRLARFGYGCGTLSSVTWEEAPPLLRDWLPQRRRWLKGWMQTFITHTRRPRRLFKDLGPARATHALALLVSNTFGPAVGLWITLYVLHETIAGDFLETREGLLQSVAWLWAGLASFGAISILVPTAVAVARVKLWSCAPFLLLRPLHWMCFSAAALRALYDLWIRPHHWSKTRHGLASAPAPEGDAAP